MAKIILKKKFIYVDNQRDLELLIKHIKRAKLFALDTEFVRKKTYYPILSLIQIAVKLENNDKKLFIIDCHSNLNLKGFYDLMADAKIKKILHSASQDLQIFFHRSQLVPKAVYDTQVMANFCGLEYGVGYSSLVKTLFNKKLCKEQQMSDWQKRPLTFSQINYALLDVAYLHEIFDILSQKIAAEKRDSWYEEEIENVVNNWLFRSDEFLMKNFIFKNRSANKIWQTKKIILLREKWAKIIDVPRQHLLRDEAITKMVLTGKIQGKINKKIAAQVEEILKSEQEFCEEISACETSYEKKGAMNPAQKELLLNLKEKVAEIAKDQNFKEQFLINASDVKKLVVEKALSPKFIKSWRYQVLGQELEKMLEEKEIITN